LSTFSEKHDFVDIPTAKNGTIPVSVLLKFEILSVKFLILFLRSKALKTQAYFQRSHNLNVCQIMRLPNFVTSLLILLSSSRANGNSTNHSADGPFAQTINGKIVCDEVIEKEGTYLDENGEIGHETTFSCFVNPSYTETGSKYIELDLVNFSPSFEEERDAAYAVGKTQLAIYESSIQGSTIILPSQNESSNIIACPTGENFLHKDDGEQSQCFVKTLNWHSPPSYASRRSRKLAVNQVGQRSILVFRITTTTNGAPTASSATVSDKVFGPTDTVNIATQFAACSNNKFDFIPAASTGLTLSATGVHDITVTTTSTSTTSDIKNAVKTAVGNSVFENTDHAFYHVVVTVIS
jgi:hypothetical protein